ncbi:MAG: RrF2 family transcriptional regulator [Candidatus Zixiibacteriota bacterium]
MIYQRQITYSLKALAFLAGTPENTVVSVKEMAEKLGIPRHYLGKVLTELVKKQLVMSAKGPSGGFRLAVIPESISIYSILDLMDGLSNLERSCVMGLGECVEQSPCALHDLWSEFKKNAVLRTQRLTLSDFSQSLSGKIEPSVEKRIAEGYHDETFTQ